MKKNKWPIEPYEIEEFSLPGDLTRVGYHYGTRLTMIRQREHTAVYYVSDWHIDDLRINYMKFGSLEGWYRALDGKKGTLLSYGLKMIRNKKMKKVPFLVYRD